MVAVDFLGDPAALDDRHAKWAQWLLAATAATKSSFPYTVSVTVAAGDENTTLDTSVLVTTCVGSVTEASVHDAGSGTPGRANADHRVWLPEAAVA